MADIYYNRVMDSELTDLIAKKYQWLIKYVEKHPELDFQTGSNANDTWFSVYRGTGRVFTIKKDGTLKADKKYMDDLFPDFYQTPNKENLDELMKKVSNDFDLKKYYIGKDGKKKEGYYQNLISRRYSLFCEKEDNFIIFDKEFVLGYCDADTKDEAIKDVKKKYDIIIEKLKEEFGTGIKAPGSECDFVGLTKDGDILMLELKRHEDTSKIALSPVQVGKYVDLTNNYLSKPVYKEEFEKCVKDMIAQKKELGILNPQWDIPQKITGKIIPAVVVGGNPSETAKDRFKIARNMVKKPDIKLYTCNDKGELVEIPL